MRLMGRMVGVFLAMAGFAATALLGGSQALAASDRAAPSTAAASWQLIDYQQSVCYVSTRGGTSYYGIWISGSWTHTIDVGASGLPAGGSYYTSYAPIPPGSSDGVGSLAYVAVVLPSTPVAVYPASIWADDGTTRESVPVTIRVQDRCGHY